MCKFSNLQPVCRHLDGHNQFGIVVTRGHVCMVRVISKRCTDTFVPLTADWQALPDEAFTGTDEPIVLPATCTGEHLETCIRTAAIALHHAGKGTQ